MKLPYRLWSISALVFAALLAPFFAQAQDYPTREIRAICNFPAGTGADIYVRYFADRLSKLAGKQVIVDNKAGALGVIGTEAAARAKPDGYTIYIAPASASHASSVHLFKKLPFDPVKDFIPVTTLAKLSFVLVIDPKSPIKTVAELTAHIKAKQGKAAFGATAPTALVAAELYKKYAGLQITKVQYKDYQGPMNDMFAGNLEFFFADSSFAAEQVRAGRLKALAVTGDRTAALPGVPTMAEAGVKEFGNLSPWWAVFVPAKTPQPIVAKLEAWFNQIVASPETKKWLNDLAADPFPGNGKLVADLLKKELKDWGEYVKIAGIQPQ